MFQCALCSIIPFCNALFTVLIASDVKQFTLTPNLVVLVISSVMILFALFKFYFHAFHFMPLRLFYRITFLAQNHCFLHILATVAAVSLLCAFPRLPFLPLIPLSSMILYTLILRPHLSTPNNIRSVCNYIAMCGFVGLKMHFESLRKSTLANTNTVLWLCAYVTVCLALATVSLFFHCAHLRTLWGRRQKV